MQLVQKKFANIKTFLYLCSNFIGKTDKIDKNSVGKTDKIAKNYIGKTDGERSYICLKDTLTAW